MTDRVSEPPFRGRGQLTLLALSLFLVLGLVSCARSARTMNSPPAFPGAVVLEEGENTSADLMASTLREFTTVEANIDITTYALPEDSSWDAVRSHYSDAFAGSNWTLNDSFTMEYEYFQSRGWRRGGAGQGEAFVISYILDPADGTPLLTVGRFSE